MIERHGRHSGPKEKRAFGRRAIVRYAWVLVGSRNRLPCRIRNLSMGGALLELEVPAWLPYTFELAVENPAVTIFCEVRHRGQHGIGVQFVGNSEGVRRLCAEGGEVAATVAPEVELLSLGGRVQLPAAAIPRFQRT